MRIAHLLPYSAFFPLHKHNGRYEWVLRFARMQAASGHQVTMYAAPGSGQGIEELQWLSISRDEGSKDANNRALVSAALANPDIDIFHSSFDYLHYELGGQTTKPVVSTQHWFPNELIARAAQTQPENVFTVASTRFMAQKDKELGIRVTEVIPLGIDLNLFQPDKGRRTDRLLFVGRITANKGVLEAVQAALQAGVGLDIIGKVNKSDQAYWDSILPLIDGEHIRYLGPKTQPEVARALASAKALIFPSKTEEAFGQVTVEAQACGTPVIISNVGASAELVIDRQTGYVVSSPSGYVQAIHNLDTIDRQACRQNALRFDIRTMYARYDALYHALTD